MREREGGEKRGREERGMEKRGRKEKGGEGGRRERGEEVESNGHAGAIVVVVLEM